MGRPDVLTDKRHYDPVFDEDEEWPEMLAGCETKRATLDNEGERAHRYASLRTVRRTP